MVVLLLVVVALLLSLRAVLAWMAFEVFRVLPPAPGMSSAVPLNLLKLLGKQLPGKQPLGKQPLQEQPFGEQPCRNSLGLGWCDAAHQSFQSPSFRFLRGLRLAEGAPQELIALPGLDPHDAAERVHMTKLSADLHGLVEALHFLGCRHGCHDSAVDQ